jgi:large subunit ribosomal protein L14
MIKQGTIVKIADNSGAKTAKCIKILGGYKKKTGKIGEIIIVSIQKLRDKISFKKSKIKKKDIFKAIILQTKFVLEKKSKIKFKFKDNYIALLDKQNNPLATRIIGFVTKKLKKKYNKFLTISSKKFLKI